MFCGILLNVCYVWHLRKNFRFEECLAITYLQMYARNDFCLCAKKVLFGVEHIKDIFNYISIKKKQPKQGLFQNLFNRLFQPKRDIIGCKSRKNFNSDGKNFEN
ncbi:hypothetical protein ABEB36_010878 [Hypothenemus hampei]|uniref:Uncharacterized protein n=1 Tax=Hypothenemus hampei TaxID=57062 RepID=A0ABD1EDD3_HYPHA